MRQNAKTHNLQTISGIAFLTAAIGNIKLYSKDHPQVQRYIEKAYKAISEELLIFPDLTYILVGDDIVVNNTPIKDKGPHLSQLHRMLKENGIERLSFMRGLTQLELHEFIKDITSPDIKSIQSRPAIRLGKVRLVSPNQKGVIQEPGFTHFPIEKDDQKELLDRIKQIPIENIQEIYADIKRQKNTNITGMNAIVESFIKGFSYGLRPLEMLGNLKSADQYTFTHVVNVCLLTMAQAEAIGIKGNELYNIGIAAVLHDVGKLFVPDEILNKPGALTKEERDIIENHSLSGAQYILKLSDVSQLAVLGALEHHIRFDGSGYPFINSHWRPHIISQMIAIADIYDAMRSRRPYQPPKPEELILQILKKEKGTSFNPGLVDNFLYLLGRDAPLNPE